MKTFLVTVKTPKPRSGFHTSKGVVSGVDSPEAAIEAAKGFYPPDARGWDKTATFEAKEIPAGTFFQV